jgi:hypothetical protein
MPSQQRRELQSTSPSLVQRVAHLSRVQCGLMELYLYCTPQTLHIESPDVRNRLSKSSSTRNQDARYKTLVHLHLTSPSIQYHLSCQKLSRLAPILRITSISSPVCSFSPGALFSFSCFFTHRFYGTFVLTAFVVDIVFTCCAV